MKYVVAILSLVVLAPPVRAQVRFGPEERRILTIADERRDADSLLPYLASHDARIARRAAIGLANIGDTSVRWGIVTALRIEPRDSVADAEAFALGMLGPDSRTYNALTLSTIEHPTTERLKALARMEPTMRFGSATAKLVATLGEAGKIDHRMQAEAYMELASKRADTAFPRMRDDVEILGGDDDPQARWRAAYIFARYGDSADLALRRPRLQELLNDQGSPYCRMFAALALGRLHNDVADTLLYRAFRSEEDWRVRVNILNAFARFPVLDSLNFITIVRAAYGARQDDPLSIHVGLTAQSVLEQIVRAGKVPKPLIPSVRAWLNGFGDPDAHPDIARIVLAAATPAATLLATPSDSDAIRNYGQANNVYEREYSVRAMGSTDNVDYFGNLLSTMTYVSPLEQLWRLEALDSLWQRAKREPAFRAKLEANHFANVYRYLLIRVSSVVDDPAVVTTALDHLRDSTILTDTLFRNEAGRYLLKYLHSFAEHAYRDQLLAAITAEVWMKADSKPLEKALTVVGDSAQHWRDNELMDSLYSAFGAIGVDHKAWVRLKRESHIDWNYLERLPDKMTINLDRGSIELRLLTDEAPLTVLNMVRLAKGQYFTNQRVHRVVPNFVIQSGDPTGTGWGGPGFTIRSEFTPHEYDHEGVVGMARDGKDTESSQWFITHCPTPNLDTRYTVWAEVTGGMRTVMSVQRGDKVQTVVSHK